MKYVPTIITFSVCLLTILESSNCIRCYQCNSSNPGCILPDNATQDDLSSIPSSYLIKCPTTIKHCATRSVEDADGNSKVDKRECLPDDQYSSCHDGKHCFACSVYACNV